MSVFQRDAFTMSALPTPASSLPSSTAPSRKSSFSSSSIALSRRGSFSNATPHIVTINVESVLFDMDGTLINSSPAVNSAWKLFAQKYPLNLDEILKSAHGMRTIDVMKKWVLGPNCDPEVLAAEVVRFETAILEAAEEIGRQSGKAGIEVLPGVAKLLDDLSSEKDKRGGEEKWAICTSSTYFYAGKAIPIAGLTTPKVFITADSVTRGKPFPDPYLLGASGCKASPFESLVVEDAPTGIRAGKAAGCLVLATATSHTREQLEKERPDFLVQDLSFVKAFWDPITKTFRIIIEQPIDRIETRPTPDTTPLTTPAVSRAGSFSGLDDKAKMRAAWGKPSDELTGNDSVVGSPFPSRPGSPGAGDEGVPVVGGGAPEGLLRRLSKQEVTLEAFKRAMAGNATKRRPSNSGLVQED